MIENIGLEKLQFVCYKFYGKVMWKENTLDTTASPIMNTKVFLRMGLKQDNTLQTVEGITIYPTGYFAPEAFRQVHYS